jgi:sugar lactone lactonase YvrE
MTEKLTGIGRIRRTLAGLLAIAIAFAVQPILPVAAAGPPPNDNRATPRVLTNGHVITASMRGATAEPTDLPRPVEEGGGAFTQTVWFQITVPVRSQVTWYAAPVGGSTMTSILSKVVSTGASGPVLEEISHCSAGGFCPPGVNNGFVPAGTTLMLMVGGGFSVDQQREFRIRFDVASDIDGDSKTVYEDNCPQVANPLQEDTAAGGRIADDGLGDACEPIAGAAPANDHFVDATLVEADPFASLAIAKMTTRNATITLGEDDQPGAIMVDPFIADHPANVASVWFKVPVATPLPDPSWGCCNSFITKLPTPIGGFTYYQVTRSQPNADVVRVQFSDGNLGDTDGDSWNDVDDNCVDIANPQQEDNDLDGIGNACDPTPGELIVNDDPDTATPITIGARGPAPVAAPSYGGTVAGASADLSVPGFTGTAVWYRIAIPTTSAYEFELPRAFVDGGGSLRVFASDGVEPINVGSFDALDQFVPRLTSTKAIYSVPVYGTTTLFVAVVAPPSSSSPQTFTLQGFTKFNSDALGSHVEEFTSIPANFTWLYSTAGATRQTDEPAHGGVATGASVWETFVFPTLGSVQFNVQIVSDHRGLVDSSAPRRVNIYQGPAGTSDPSTLTTIPGTAQPSPNVTAVVVQPCQTYYVAIDTDAPGVPVSLESIFTSYGDPVIDCHANDNDNPSGAFPFTVGSRGPNPTVGTQINGTVENATPDPGIAGLVGSAVWFKWTVPATGIYEFELPKPFIDSGGGFKVFGSDGPTANVASFAERVPRQPLNPLNVGGKSIFGYPAYAGETLYLAVARTSAFQSVMQFTLEGFKAFFNDDVGNATLRTTAPGGANAIDLLESTVGARRQAGEPDHNGNADGASTWEAFRFQQAGSLQLSSQVFSDNNVVDPDTEVNLSAYTGPLGVTDPAALAPVTAFAGPGTIQVPIVRCQTYYLAIETVKPGVPLQLNGGFYADSASSPVTCGTTTTVVNASVGDVSVLEGTSTNPSEALVTVMLDAPTPSAITIGAYTQDGTATSADYTAVSPTLTIPAGSSSGIIRVPITADSVLELNETFKVYLGTGTGTNVDVISSTTPATVSIVDDDAPIPTSTSTKKIYTYQGDGSPFTLNKPISLLHRGSDLFIADQRTIIKETNDEFTYLPINFSGGEVSPSVDGMAFDTDGSIILSQLGYRWLRQFFNPGIGLLTGIGTTPATQVTTDAAGNVYWVEPSRHLVRRLLYADRPTFNVMTIAGTGVLGSAGDGSIGTAAKIDSPSGIAVTPDGNTVYFTEAGNGRIRKLDRATGRLSTLTSRLSRPGRLFLSGDDLYVSESDLGRVVKITDITSLAPTLEVLAGSTAGFSGDGSIATAAQLSGPGEMALDTAGNLYIADSLNNRVRIIGDVPPPHLTIAAPSEGADLNTAIAQIEWVVTNPPATTRCSVDGAASVPCTSPFTTPALSLGAHTVAVTAANSGPGATTKTVHFNYVSGLAVAITTGPTTGTPSLTRRPMFTFTIASPAALPATATCAIDGAAPVSCTSPFTASLLTNGNHTLIVVATNAVDSKTTTRSFVVNAPFRIRLTSGPRNPIPSRVVRPTFAFVLDAESNGLPTECAVDSGAFVPCASPYTTPVLTEAAHVLHIRGLENGSILGTYDYPFLVQTTFNPNDPPAWTLPGSSRPSGYWISVNTDRQGRIYVNDGGCHVYRVEYEGTLTNIVAPIAGNPDPCAGGGNQVAFDSIGNAYLAGGMKVTPAGVVSPSAAGGSSYGIAVDSHDNVYTQGDGRIYRTRPTGEREIFVDLLAVGFGGMEAMNFDGQDNLYVSAGEVVKITQARVVSRIAPSVYTDGLAVDFDGNVFTASGYRIDAVTGTVRQLTGVGGATGSCDGRPASQITALSNHHAAVDSQGHLYINYLTHVCVIEGVLNVAPKAIGDTLSVAVNDPGKTVDVSTNDFDPEGGSLTFAMGTQGAKGVATCTATGMCTYVPNVDASGVDTFTYVVTDNAAKSATGTVTVTIGSPAIADSFMPVAPVRLLDTRPTKMAPGGQRTIQVTGVAGVPVGATAVALNVAAVDPVHAGHLRVFPTGGAVPTASVLNFGAGKNTPNQVIVPVGVGGSITVYAGDTTNVIVDINGYFVGDGSRNQYVPVVSPTRIQVPSLLPGATAGVTAPSSIDVTVLGAGGIPASGVSAVLVNVGALNPSAAGHLRVYSAGDPLPDSSTHNFSAGDSRMNLVLVRPGVDGKITVYNAASGSVTVTVDTVGYFTSGGQGFKPVSPVRSIDTRELAFGDGLPVAPGAFREVQIRGFAGIPVGAKNVVINVAAVNPAGSGSIDVGPSGSSPLLPSFTHPAGENVANLVVVPIGADGKIRIVNNSAATTHFIADITGYFRE